MWVIPDTYLPSSVSAQDMLESKEDLTLLESSIESSLMWRSKPSPLRTWSRRWKTAPWTRLLFSRTLKPSRQDFFEKQLTSSLEATRANRLARLASALEKTTLATSGPTSQRLSGSYDPEEYSSRMSRATLASGLMKSSATWKNEVTTRRGEYSARLKLARLIREKESSSWATPNTMDHLPQRSDEALRRQATTTRKGRSNPSNLREQVDPRAVQIYKKLNWPSICAGDYRTPPTNPAKSGQKVAPASEHALPHRVRQAEMKVWPTPAARDFKGARGKAAQARKGNPSDTLPNAMADPQINWPTPRAGNPGSRKAGTGGRVSEEVQKANWPTPDVAQAQKVSNRPNHGQLGLANHPEVHGKDCNREPMKKDRAGQPGQDKSSTTGKNQGQFGALNPDWVEHLMGVPPGWTQIGWTESDYSETE